MLDRRGRGAGGFPPDPKQGFKVSDVAASSQGAAFWRGGLLANRLGVKPVQQRETRSAQSSGVRPDGSRGQDWPDKSRPVQLLHFFPDLRDQRIAHVASEPTVDGDLLEVENRTGGNNGVRNASRRFIDPG